MARKQKSQEKPESLSDLVDTVRKFEEQRQVDSSAPVEQTLPAEVYAGADNSGGNPNVPTPSTPTGAEKALVDACFRLSKAGADAVSLCEDKNQENARLQGDNKSLQDRVTAFTDVNLEQLKKIGALDTENKGYKKDVELYKQKSETAEAQHAELSEKYGLLETEYAALKNDKDKLVRDLLLNVSRNPRHEDIVAAAGDLVKTEEGIVELVGAINQEDEKTINTLKAEADELKGKLETRSAYVRDNAAKLLAEAERIEKYVAEKRKK